MKAREKLYFDKIADLFDNHYNVYSKPTGRLRVKRRLALFSKHCQLRTGLKVLEIGCGTGEYSRGLMECGCALFSTDISFNMLNKATKKIAKQNNIHFFISDSEELAVKDNVFDAVVGNSVLHHLDVRKVLSQIFRALKKSGKVAFSEPNMLNPQIFLQKNIKFFKKISGDSLNETAFTRWYIKNIFEEAGFKNIAVKPFDFLHPYTPLSIVRIIEKLALVLEKILLVKEISGSLLITGEK